MTFGRWLTHWFDKRRQQGIGQQSRGLQRKDRRLTRPLFLEPLEQRNMMTVSFPETLLPTSYTSAAIKDLLIPLSASDSNGGSITYSVVNNTNGANIASIVTDASPGTTAIVFNISGKDGSNQDFTGEITVLLFDDLAPNTIARIKELISQQFYNGLTFHRIVGLGGGSTARIAQGGDPQGNGSGGPGTQIDDEFNSTMTFNSPGLLAMAKSTDDTNGSQFFFVNADPGLANSPQHLNFNHTIVGQVISGFSTLNKLMNTPVSSSVPNSTMRINSVREVTDNQHGVLRFNPTDSFSGSASVTVRATASNGQTADQTFNITIQADTQNQSPFLNSLPAQFQNGQISTAANTPVTFNLSATDLENDALTFQILDDLTGLAPSGDVTASVVGNQVTLTPANGFVGTVRLRARVTGANTGASSSPDDNQAFTLVVGDVPTVTLQFQTPSILESSGSTTLIATLSQTSSENVTVRIGYGGTAILNSSFPVTVPSDYSATTSITILAGQTSASISISVVNDSITELNETVVARILSADGASAPAPGPQTLTIIDNEPTAVRLSISPNQFNENAGTATLTATLAHTVTQDVTVAIVYSGSAANVTDYLPSSATITILAGQLSGSITLTGVNDTISEGDETVIATLGTLTSSSAVIPDNNATTATVTIKDDEPLPGITLDVTPSSVPEASGAVTIRAKADRVSANPIVVNLSYTGSATFGADFSGPTTITIPAGSTSASITLSMINDTLVETDETIVVGYASLQNGQVNSSETHTVIITNDDTAPTNVDLDAGSDSGSSQTDNYTSFNTPVIRATAGAGQTLEILVNGVVSGTMTDAGTPGQYAGAITAGKLAVGENSITTRVLGTTQASSPLTITYAPSYNSGYTVPGALQSTRTYTFTLPAMLAAYRSEVGLFVADDATGTVGGVAPGDAGYAQAALQSAARHTIFARGANVGSAVSVELTGGQVLGFYLIPNSTRERFLEFNPTNDLPRFAEIPRPVALFSFDTANPDGIRHVQSVADPLTGVVEYHWEDLVGGGDRDFNDFVIRVNPVDNPVAGEVIRVPGSSATTVATNFQLTQGKLENGSTSGFTKLGGEFGVIAVDNARGTVGGLNPGDAGWLAAALATRQSVFSAGAAAGASASLNLTGGKQLAFYAISEGTAAELLAANPTNSATDAVFALFSFDEANPDDSDHFRWFGPESTDQGSTVDKLQLHVMDALLGGAADFDRYVVSINM